MALTLDGNHKLSTTRKKLRCVVSTVGFPPPKTVYTSFIIPMLYAVYFFFCEYCEVET